MSREIDISALTDEDVPYILQRPWLAEQVLHQGYKLPSGYYKAQDLPEPEPEFVAEGGEVVVPEEPQNYNELTVSDLRDLLAERGLPTGGNKAELIDRLEEDDGTSEDEEEDIEEDDE